MSTATAYRVPTDLQKTFAEAWNAIPTKIAFSEEWVNSKGYMDDLVKVNLGLRPGDTATFVTPEPTNRRGILIGTRFGNIVLFEYYSPDVPPQGGMPAAYRSRTIVGNYPAVIANYYRGDFGVTTSVSNDALKHLLGPCWALAKAGDGNIGYRIEDLFGRR